MILEAKIENFKSIKDQTLRLGRFNVIVGKNGSGKTNFISAIQLLKGLSQGNSLDSTLEDQAPMSVELFYLPTHKQEASFEFYIIANDKNKYRFSYSIHFSKLGSRFRFSIPHEELTKINSDSSEQIYRRERDSVYAGADQGLVPFKVEPDKLMLSAYADDSVRAVVSTLKNYSFIDSTLTYKAGWILIDANRAKLETIDGVAVALFTKDKERFNSAIKSIQKILPNLASPTISSFDDQVFEEESSNPDEQDDTTNKKEESARYLVTWREKIYGLEDRFSQVSLSHGDRRIIHLILSLYNAEEETFFALEEIENGMHLGRLGKLMDELRTQAANRKIQLLLTTHSNEILSSVSPKEVIFCKKGPQGTELVHLSESEEYKEIREELGEEHTAADAINTGLF